MLVFGCAHLIVPIYAAALSYYDSNLTQTIIYYFSSAVTTLATILLAAESLLALLGLFEAAMTENA